MATNIRKFRVDDILWAEAGNYAAAAGTNVSEVIRAALESYRNQARLEEPTVSALLEELFTEFPGIKYDDARDAVRSGAQTFGIDLGHLDDEGREAIRNYARGWLSHI